MDRELRRLEVMPGLAASTPADRMHFELSSNAEKLLKVTEIIAIKKNVSFHAGSAREVDHGVEPAKSISIYPEEQDMSYKISEIEGIGPVFSEKLGAAGIATTDDLLRLCANAKGRTEVSEKTGLSTSQLLAWADMADMMRLNGVGPQFSELLKAAGVDTVKELRTRNAENLTAKLAEVNAEKKLARTVPALSQVSGWIEQANATEPLISH